VSLNPKIVSSFSLLEKSIFVPLYKDNLETEECQDGKRMQKIKIPAKSCLSANTLGTGQLPEGPQFYERPARVDLKLTRNSNSLSEFAATKKI
jgi:hypothetical protein